MLFLFAPASTGLLATGESEETRVPDVAQKAGSRTVPASEHMLFLAGGMGSYWKASLMGYLERGDRAVS